MLCDSLILSQFGFGDIVYMNIDLYLQRKIQKNPKPLLEIHIQYQKTSTLELFCAA